MNVLKKIFNLLYTEFSGGSQPENIMVTLPHSRAADVKEVQLQPSEALLASTPELGTDRKELIERAMTLYHTDSSREKWLNAIHYLRKTSKRGWGMDETVIKTTQIASNVEKKQVAKVSVTPFRITSMPGFSRSVTCP